MKDSEFEVVRWYVWLVQVILLQFTLTANTIFRAIRSSVQLDI